MDDFQREELDALDVASMKQSLAAEERERLASKIPLLRDQNVGLLKRDATDRPLTLADVSAIANPFSLGSDFENMKRLFADAKAAGEQVRTLGDWAKSAAEFPRLENPLLKVTKEIAEANEAHRRQQEAAARRKAEEIRSRESPGLLDQLLTMIHKRESSLRADQDLAVITSRPGSHNLMLLRSVTCLGPHCVALSGTNVNGDSMDIIQHIHNLNIELIVTQKPDPNEVRKPIGFSIQTGD